MATILWSKEPLLQVKNNGDLHGGQRSSEVKRGKLCAMATKLGQKNRWYKLRMMMTFMEVKGHQRSNVVNYVLWLPHLVKRTTLMQSKNDGDLHGGQRSSEVKRGNKVFIWRSIKIKTNLSGGENPGSRSSACSGGFYVATGHVCGHLWCHVCMSIIGFPFSMSHG